LADDLSAAGLRAAFESVQPFTVGIEEEVMLLDSETLDLAPRAAELLDRVAGDARFKAELPAAQVEIVTEPKRSAAEALDALQAGRRDLARAAEGLARLAVAGTHPFADPEGELSAVKRYDRIRAEYGPIARRQLVAALQVHVAVGGAERALAAYNGLRPYLPELAALGANARFHDGRDTGLASVRPKISELLPRQGVPPALDSWDRFAEELRWGARAGAVAEPRLWWWELRPHPRFGTLEVRVPDAQTTVAEAAGVVGLVHALVASIAERHDAGEELPAAPRWRIEENRWSAARHGVEGAMADLRTGEPEPTRQRLLRLIGDVEPAAARLGSAQALSQARCLVEANGAIRQRTVGRSVGARGLTAWMAERFLLAGPPCG